MVNQMKSKKNIETLKVLIKNKYVNQQSKEQQQKYKRCTKCIWKKWIIQTI